MRISSLLSLPIGVAFIVLHWLAPASAGDDPWPDIQAGVFDSRPIAENDGSIALYVPEQAEDAALVPVAVHMPPSIANAAKSLTLIIDRNPAPVAATFRFGEAFSASPDLGERKLMTRIRIDSFSNVRAVLETADGKLHMATRFVRGAGGCSAPASKDADEALASLGKMQVKTATSPAHGDRWREGIVMIRHPNFTGMQMDIVSRGYTPARYVDLLEVTRGGSLLLRMEGGISISENPNIRFNYDGSAGDALEVRAKDSDGTKFAGKSLPTGS
ncbi:MAG: quinoprotein dehydrogenase-associated SoxYZ-like carrier [Hyphomicrobium sp.]